jgi:hypothetical protein
MISKDTQNKINKFFINPSKEFLLTLEEYNRLTPFEKGYWSYLQSSWPESEIPEDKNPFEPGTTKCSEFIKGSYRGMLYAQDSE